MKGIYCITRDFTFEMSKPMTKAQRLNAARTVGLGCVCCLSQGIEDVPAEIHHIGTGGGGRRDHDKIIGLCPTHHRNGGYGVALHAGRKEFEKNFSTEQEFFQATQEILAQ